MGYSQPGSETVPPAVEEQSFKHWTIKGFPLLPCIYKQTLGKYSMTPFHFLKKDMFSSREKTTLEQLAAYWTLPYGSLWFPNFLTSNACWHLFIASGGCWYYTNYICIFIFLNSVSFLHHNFRSKLFLFSISKICPPSVILPPLPELSASMKF